MTDSITPDAEPDDFDVDLAAALDTHRTEENVRDNARLVAAYHTTLIENGVDADNATKITCLWLNHCLGGDS